MAASAKDVDHFGRLQPYNPRTTMGDMFNDPHERPDTMRSTHNRMFGEQLGETRKRSPRPTSRTRKNNPHSSKTFQSRTLPSGEVIHVATPAYSDLVQRAGAAAAKPAQRSPAEAQLSSTARETFAVPAQEPWQRGNTQRYGLNSKPWANSAYASVGITPTVSRNQLSELSATLPTTREAFRGGNDFERFAPTSSRRSPAKFDSQERELMQSVIRDEAADDVESWIKSAPGFEGEVVKRMMREIGTRVNSAATSPQAAHSVPACDFVSEWAGP